MARRVHFADEADEERFSLDKRNPTPHPRKFGAARRRDSTSSSSQSEESAPINRSRRSKKGSRSSNSDSSRRRGVLSKRGIVSRGKQCEDGRGSAKERKRKSQLVRNLPRRSNGTFAPLSGLITPPNLSSRPSFQQQSDSEENDSNSESDSGEASFLNTTGPKLPVGKYIQQFVKTPEGQKLLKKQLMKTLNEMGGSLLNFDSDDDEQDRNMNPTPPRQRRSSSRSRM